MDINKNKKIIETNKTIQPELSRELTLFQLTMMGAGMMIGAGVFVATGVAIGEAGSGGILIAFALNGLIAIFSAMSFAELSSALPAAGGAYTYIKQAFGGIIGFISGWMNWFALAVAGSLYAITFATYTIHLLKELESFSFLLNHLILYEKILAFLVAIFFISINFKGVSDTGKSSTYIAVAQTLTLGIIGVLGIVVALNNPDALINFSPFVDKGFDKILLAMGFTYVGFEGFEVIGHAGEEAIDPKKNIPKAILYAVIIVVTTYLLVAFAAVVGAKPENGTTVIEWFHARGATGFADAIQSLFPFGGMLLVTMAAIFSSTSALNATIYSSSRVAFAMGRDGQLPKKMAVISEKKKVPATALTFSSIIIIIVAVTFNVEAVAAAADIMFLLIFMLINVSVIKIRKEIGDELEYGYKMPFFPVIPVIALISQLMLSFWLFNLQPISWAVIIGWIVAGIAFYYLYAKSHTKNDIPYRIFKSRVSNKQQYRILATIVNCDNMDIITKYIRLVAKKRDAKIELLNIIEVPDIAPLRSGAKYLPERKLLLKKVENLLGTSNKIERIIRYSHSISKAVISASKEHATDLTVIPWKGYSKTSKHQLGKSLDTIIERTPTDLLVIKAGEDVAKIKRILIPTTGGIHSIMSCDIASILTKAYNCEVVLFNIYGRDDEKARRLRKLKPLTKFFKEDKVSIKCTKSSHIVSTILEESKDYDLVIVGASQESAFQHRLFGSISQKIASECDKTVFLVKRDLGVRSWAKRWLGKKII